MLASLGSTMLTNGDFATGDLTGWTAAAGWSATTFKAVHNGGISDTTPLTQSVSLVSGSVYEISVTTSSRTTGSLALTFGSLTGSYTISTNTTTRQTFTATATASFDLTFTPAATFNGAVDDVTCKLVTANSTPLEVWNDSSGSAFAEIRGSISLFSYAIGINAQRYLTTGTQNTSIGYTSQQSLTTGGNNSAFGSRSQFALTTGSHNNAFGRNSQAALTIGDYNDAFGRQSQYVLTTGSTNTAFGTNSQVYLTTGSGNSGSGAYSLSYVTDGSYNTGMGNSTGFNPANDIVQYRIASDTYMTLIGYGATKDNAATLTNSIAIGYAAHITKSNQAVLGDTTITETLLRGAIIQSSSDATTNTITNLYTLDHDTSGTPAAGFGTGLLLQLKSSTTNDQDAAAITTSWTTATHSSRSSKLTIQTVDSAGSLTDRVLFDVNGLQNLMTDTIRVKDYTLTVPATGTVVEGTGTATRLAYWNGANTLTSNDALTFDGTTLTNNTYYSSVQTINSSATSAITATLAASTLQDGSAYTGTDYTASTMYFGVQITASAAHTMGDFEIKVKYDTLLTNPTATFAGYIYADDGGSPSKPTGSALATGLSVRFGTITATYQVLSVGTTYTMTNGVKYWLVIKWSATPTGGNLVFDSDVSANRGATSTDGSTWTNTTARLYHIIRGLTGLGATISSTNNYGIYVSSVNNCGIYALSTNYRAIQGISTNSIAGYFSSTNRYAIYGISTNDAAIYGTSTSGQGVVGVSVSSYGLQGVSTSDYGFVGTSTTGVGGVMTINPATTNTLAEAFRIQRLTSATAAVGIGGYVSYYLENDAGATVYAGNIGCLFTTVTAGIESSDIVFYNRLAGTTAEKVRIVSDGSMTGTFIIGNLSREYMGI